MTSKIRLISDIPLIVFTAIYYLITFIGCTLAIWLVNQPDIVANENDIVPIQIIFVVLLCILSFGIVAVLWKSICLVTLTQDTITVQTGFVNKKTFSYKCFPYIYLGTYFHRNLFGIGMTMRYIVFSRSRVSQEMLCAVNKLKCTHDVFKIRYTPNNCKKIRNIIPFEMQRKFDAVISDSRLR